MIDLKTLNPYLQNIILECMSSENDMWFVEYDDEEINHHIKNKSNFLEELMDEVLINSLNGVIRFEEDDCYITVYGGVNEMIF